MANGIFGWDAASASANGTIDTPAGINVPEGTTAMSALNNADRGTMMRVAQWRDILSYPTAGGSANALTLTPGNALTSYVTGMVFTFRAASNNSNVTVTLNISAVGTKNIRKIVNGADVALEVGDIIAATRHIVVYDAAANSAAGAWVLLNPQNSITLGGDVTLSRSAANTLSITSGTPTSTVLNLPGGKIAFPAAPTLSSDPYILDRFGQGTWTPRFAPQTGAFGAVTYSEQTGTFTVIGNQSIENFSLTAATVDAGTGGGQLRIEGRPYTGVGNQAGYIAVSVGFITNHPCSCSSANGTTALLLYYRSTVNGRTFTLATSTEVPIGPGVAPWTASVWGGGAFVA